MIQRKGNYIYVKDIEVPDKLIATLECKILYKKLNTVNNLNIDLSPVPYIKRSGIMPDLLDYMSDKIKEIFDCFTKNVGIREFMENFKDYPNEITSLQRILLNARSAFESKEVVEDIYMNGLFSNFFIDIISMPIKFDYKIWNKFSTSLDLFNVLFRFSSFNCNGDAYATNNKMNIYEFLDMLFNIFMFYVSEERRNEVISHTLNTAYSITYNDYRPEVLQYDYNLEKYLYYYSKDTNTFKISDMADEINVPHNMSEKYDYGYSVIREGGEKCSPFEKIKLKAMKGHCDETFVTTLNRSGFRTVNNMPCSFGNNMIDTYFAYRSYCSGNVAGKDAAVSINVYTKHIVDEYNDIYNIMTYCNNPFYTIYYKNYYSMTVSYDLFDKKLLKDKLNDSNYLFACDVCYFSKGGGCTFKSADNLKTTKIPKIKRDCIFEALCNLCYELDIEPQLIIDKLDVNFKRLYKKPIDLQP